MTVDVGVDVSVGVGVGTRVITVGGVSTRR